MNRRNLLSFFFYVNLAIVIAILSYRVYLYMSAPGASAILAHQIARIEDATSNKDTVSFAVVGEANNSIGVFEEEIIPRINASDMDFVVSAGNIVSGGGEDKYRAILGTLSHLRKPYLLTFADHEFEEFGSNRFYQRFGPHFYSVDVGAARLVFLDATGRTPTDWQERWMRDILEDEGERTIIVFSGHPIIAPQPATLFRPDSGSWSSPRGRARLLRLLDEVGADVVVTAGASTFSDQTVGGIRHIVTGGAGGLVINDETSYYHYLQLTAGPDGVAMQVLPVDTAQTLLARRLEGLWFYIYSLFYVGMWNFLLLFSCFVVIGVLLFNRLFRERQFYPRYDGPGGADLGRPMRIAMFTNSYLPFIGGVPVSVDRLKRGLEAQGHNVMLVAPSYGEVDNDPTVLRVPALFRTGSMVRIANPLHLRTRRAVRAFAPDIVHVHHPFWLGSLGLWMARSLKIPVVFTYHTRLEQFAHLVPLPGALFRNVVAHWIISRFANRCDRVIVPTPVTRDYIRLIGVDVPVEVQPTGVDLNLYQGHDAESLKRLRDRISPDGRLLLVTVARLSKEKNVGFIIRNMAELKRRGSPDFRLMVLGDGEERAELETMVRSLDLMSDVTFLGDVPAEEVPSHLGIADIFVFASSSETQGMVILEAMAAGLPVVAVNSSGIDAFVENRRTGMVTQDDPQAWSDALHALILDPEQRRAMSQAAREAAAQYSLENFSANVAEVFQTTIAAHRGPRRTTRA